ncbi:MAG: hypothetical protein R3324_11745 [Halobacteriales archaeon]|nr:hypothetical protein [Halobacteriales archaeon]
MDRPILLVDGGGLFVVSDTGGTAVSIHDDPEIDALFALWSPRGTHVLMWARANDGSRDFHVLETNGENRVQVSDAPLDADGFPAWSPDGSRLAFRNDAMDLFVVSRDGSGQTELTPGDLTGTNPHWSPDGEWIAYQGSDASATGIFRVRPDGSDRTLLRALPWEDDRMPRYSPDGTRIAFSSDMELYVMDADGANPVPLTATPDEGDWYPRWSPDGRRLAFHSDGGTHWAVAVVDVSSGTVLDTFGHESLDALYPSWSPDGGRIAFQIQSSVAVGEVDGDGGWEAIASGRYPSWLPGG